MEMGRLFWDLAVPVLAALMGFIWRSATQKVEQLDQRVERLEEKAGRLEVKHARLDATLESSRR